MVDQPAPAVRDYYELGDDASEAGEPFVKWLPAMRLYGFVVLAVALVAATPWASPGGWRGAAAMALVAVVTVVFSFMWVYRPSGSMASGRSPGTAFSLWWPTRRSWHCRRPSSCCRS